MLNFWTAAEPHGIFVHFFGARGLPKKSVTLGKQIIKMPNGYFGVGSGRFGKNGVYVCEKTRSEEAL